MLSTCTRLNWVYVILEILNHRYQNKHQFDLEEFGFCINLLPKNQKEQSNANQNSKVTSHIKN